MDKKDTRNKRNDKYTGSGSLDIYIVLGVKLPILIQLMQWNVI